MAVRAGVSDVELAWLYYRGRNYKQNINLTREILKQVKKLVYLDK